MLFVEGLILSFLFGLLTSYPWWIAVLLAFVLSMMCEIRALRILFCICATGFWVGLGAGLGAEFLPMRNAEIWGAVIAGILSFLLHLGDMRKRKECED